MNALSRNGRGNRTSLVAAPDRRTWLGWAGGCGLSWLTPLGHVLAAELGSAQAKGPERSLILLWLAGGPSQLETFDPHSGTAIGGNTRAVETTVRGVRFASGLSASAQHMASMTLVRNMVSKEGDHERATYYAKTGYRPIPSVTHPSIGAIACHQLPGPSWDLPRHVSILSHEFPSRGGYLGNEFDPFLIDDPLGPIPDVSSVVEPKQFLTRWADLQRTEATFQAKYARRANVPFSDHANQIARAAAMMTSEQKRAFELADTTRKERERFGHSPFGRGCLVATRLINVGVRCVEITLPGWDSHINNQETHDRLSTILDQALSGLLQTLVDQQRLEHTVVLCAGEFGRTPQINRAAGRDHWQHGYSVALAGGGLRRGVVIGATDPRGEPVNYDSGTTVAD
ncbi:MAG: DUF1501 domain-containing protein, partial [Planctomycetota bacterium]|nr:DUF1501 domain-containing protein [Planctomycetota bacterium]